MTQDILAEMHPRAGKSYLVSRYAAGWHIGSWPDLSVLHASWKVAQSEKWGLQVRKDIGAWGELVFGVELDQDRRRAGEWGIRGHEGGFLATGATGGVQGVPAHLLLTDDLVKGYEAVRSEVQLDNLADYCTTDLESRREMGCVHISIETPWSELDPHGVWRSRFPDRYQTIRMPALAEHDDLLGRKPGEALCPERISLARLEEIRDSNPWMWNALYQCRPTAEEGGIWKRKWWREPDRVYDLEERGGERWLALYDGYAVPLKNTIRFVVVDLATSKKEVADFSVVGTFALTPEKPRRMCVLEMLRQRIEAPEISPLVKRTLSRWGAKVAYYEEQGNQKWGAQYARKDGIAARTIGTAKDSDVRIGLDKVANAHNASSLAASNRLIVPRFASWVAEWEHEMLTFPNAEHDDQEDVTAWACLVADRYKGLVLLMDPSEASLGRDRPRRRHEVSVPRPVRRRDRLDDYGVRPPS